MARIFELQFGFRLGISHDEAEAIFTEGEQMASKSGDVRSRAMLLSSYGNIRGVGDGDVREHANLARQAIALAEESEDPALYMITSFFSYGLLQIGEYREGVAILDRAIELADGDLTMGAGVAVACPLAFCQTFKGGFLLNMGRIEEGRDLIERGMKLAREQGDVETVGWSHNWSVWLAYVCGEPEAALGHATQTLEIAERIGDSFSRAWAWAVLGVAEWMRGGWQAAIEAFERSSSISRERRTAVEAEALRLALLGESYLGLGEAGRAVELVNEGVEVARRRGQRIYEATTNLSLARVLLGTAGAAADREIEAALARALELAHTGERSAEPMVHVELAELAHQRGDEEERERELREAHRLFTEMGATGHAERLAGNLATPAG